MNQSSSRFIELIQKASVETTPAGALKIDDFRNHLPEQTRIYITFLPGSDFADTVQTAITLKQQNMIPIPHIAARSLASKQMLEQALQQLQAIDINEALLVGGAVPTPLGEFSATIDVLETDLFQQYGFQKLGIAGHPEGSPDFSDEEAIKALQLKSAYGAKNGLALYIATQFCFEAEPLIAWQKQLQNQGINLPVKIGVAGVASIKTLLKYAIECGIGNSMQVISKRAKDLTKLMSPFPPDDLVQALAQHIDNGHIDSDSQTLINGIHIFPLGGLKKTADWMRLQLESSPNT